MTTTKQKRKEKLNQQQSITISSSYFTATSMPRDVYTTPEDSIWGDVIKHERLQEKQWKKTWEDSLVPREVRPDFNRTEQRKKQICEDVSSFYRMKPSLTVPLKASGIVGWRSSDSENSMEYFKFQYLPEKKHLIPEQYGYYRIMKYIRENGARVPVQNEKLPQKHIRHNSKPLLC